MPLYDQRGALFGRVANGRIDMGAFEVQLAPALLGDYHQNGVVESADYTLWRNTMGQSGLVPYSGADGSGNGSIGMEDYAVWKSHFGDVLPGAGGGASSSATLAAPVASAAEPGTPHARVRGSESVYDRYFSPIATGLPGLRRVGAPHAMSDFVNGTARPNENLLLELLSATTARPIGGEAIDEFVAHDTVHEPPDGHFAAVGRAFELLSTDSPPN